MIDVLEFIFQSGWHFFGALWLLAMIPWGIGASVKAVRRDWFDNYMRLASERMAKEQPPNRCSHMPSVEPMPAVRQTAPVSDKD